jgi:hypothetical protein
MGTQLNWQGNAGSLPGRRAEAYVERTDADPEKPWSWFLPNWPPVHPGIEVAVAEAEWEDRLGRPLSGRAATEEETRRAVEDAYPTEEEERRVEAECRQAWDQHCKARGATEGERDKLRRLDEARGRHTGLRADRN